MLLDYSKIPARNTDAKIGCLKYAHQEIDEDETYDGATKEESEKARK